MNLLSKPVIYTLCALLAASLIFGGWQCSAKQAERLAHAGTKTRHAEVLRDLADKTAAAAKAVRDRETEIRGLLDSSNTAREEGIANAVKEQQRVVADVRAGTLRLQKQWAGCPASVAGAGDARPVPGTDAGAELRATGAGDLVRAADDADIQVAGLQDYARACQALTAPLP